MRTRSSRLVGREDEVARVERALQDAAAGRGSAVFITGTPGIGKTRLAVEAVGSASAIGMAILRGRGSTTGPPVPFRAVTEALLSLARTRGPALADQLGPYRPVLGRLVPDWGDATSRDEAHSLVTLAEAVLRLIALAGEGRGCLLFLDDLQDADLESLAVVEYLCGNIAPLPAVLLATIRSQPSRAQELAATAAHRGDGMLLPLRALNAQETSALVESCLDAQEGEVPEDVATVLFHHSEGTPLVVEELLHDLVSSGDLVHDEDGWHLSERAQSKVPLTLVHAVAQRASRLGRQGSELLSIASVIGQRFPIPLVQHVTQLDDQTVLGHLQAAAAAGLLAPDEREPDWYCFQHPLTAEALLALVPPAQQALLAGLIAKALADLYPGLPGEWCHLAATLRLREGRRRVAGQLYLRAGKRALECGAPGSAIALLEQAEPLLSTEGDDDERGEVLQTMLIAFAENGQLDRARDLAARMHAITPVRDTGRHVDVALRLAWAAQVAGHLPDALEHLRTARALSLTHPNERQRVAVDAIDAYLTLFGGDPESLARGEELARRAAEGAERIREPYIACQAWHAVGVAVRGRDLLESDACFHRTLDLADEHRLTTWRNYALTGLAGNAWLATADTTALEHTRAGALRTGRISLAHNIDAILALHDVLAGEHERAGHRLDACLEASHRMHLTAVTRYALMARAVLAGQRADRWAVEQARAEFARHGGESSPEMPLVQGLAHAFCALLEEDRTRAEAELAGIPADRGTYYLAGPHGLSLLLDVLGGRAGWTEHERISAASAAAMRWNRHFVLLAKAVLLGRDGDAGRAAATRAEATQVARPFPTACRLGLRLVAEAALEDRWGEPQVWLREAEEYFHRRQLTHVASACRALLRRTGAPVGQRRAGSERVPEYLRRRGVTVREFEVYQLLAQRLGNKAVAARLHISPRTAEKHVASLLEKTGLPDRGAIADHAIRHLGQVRSYGPTAP